MITKNQDTRDRTPAGLYPVRYCSNSFGSDLAMPPSVTCGFRRGDAAEYARETDRSLMQLVTALWATLALMYVSLAVISGKYPVRPGKMKCVRVATADEYLKEVYTEDSSLSEKIRKCRVYFPDDRTNRNNGDKNEHA
ncbi:conjugal transfer protein TraP (plasmid) [Escherichia coli]|nr:conjugal transfer protein TraP [Escherichia coli]